MLCKFLRKEVTQKCDFGQYATQWEHHTCYCKKIIRITDGYIVYIDKKNNIDWETADKHDKINEPQERTNREKILSQCSITEHKPADGLSERSILSFKTIVGEAIVNCFERNFDEAKEILKLADEFRIDRVIEKSRQWYLMFTTVLSAIIIFIALQINANNIPVWEGILPYSNIGAWAISGVCLSIILRSGNLKNVSYAGMNLHFIESGCRLIGGFITGQIVYLGIKSGIIFSSLVNENNHQYIICLLALLAGASERFAPSIISKIDEPSLTTETPKEN